MLLSLSLSLSLHDLIQQFRQLTRHIAIMIGIYQCFGTSNLWHTVLSWMHLTLSNPIFLPTAYSPALICFGRKRGWWITCNYPTVLKEKQKEYNLHYLLAKARTTWGKASDRFRQQANKCNKNLVGRLPTSERNGKIILLDEVRRRIRKGEVYYSPPPIQGSSWNFNPSVAEGLKDLFKVMTLCTCGQYDR